NNVGEEVKKVPAEIGSLIFRILTAAHGGHAAFTDMLCVSFAGELLIRLVVTANPAVVPVLFLLLFCHFFILLLFRLQISAFISMIVNMMQQKKTENR
uniref:hypothetical protein n=1 Tax=Bacteroides acidifaciens TaxID=85831 RepID=UPI0025A651BB